MPAATLTRRMPHYRLSPRRCRGLTASETALRSICLFLGVVGGACLCQRRRSRGACRTIACPPTLSGVNCKRDRVAVDLPVPWRCRRACLCQRRRSRGACRTIACPPTLSGVNCKRDRVAVDLPVPWRCRRACLCQRRRSRGACRTIACPPTLSGVNCKRDRVAVEKPQ